ncbi:MAG: NYN domain-containing protein [Planctomycetota bacterium]|jgi:predicted RNA-binding protein with PIN domain
MPIIIDGHNLLWMLRRSSKEPDSKLCHIITRYLRLVSEKGHIVFDGTGPKDQRAFDNISNLEVSFSGMAKEADEVIEEKILASTDPRRLTVVSSDRRLRAAARAAKASAIKSEAFWNDLNRHLNQPGKNREPRAKQNGISDSETQQWLELFGMDL